MAHNKTKELICRSILAVASMFFSTQSMAQEPSCEGMTGIAKIPLEQCESVDTAEVTRYAIVKKDGKLGLYDLVTHKNLTNIDNDELYYMYDQATVDSMTAHVFFAARDVQHGNIVVVGDRTVCVWADNPKCVASLEECSSIVGEVTSKCRTSLKEAMQSSNGVYGQAAVVDVATGQLKAWVALREIDGKYEDDKIIMKSCTATSFRPLLAACILSMAGMSIEDSVDTGIGVYNVGDGMVIRDHNWRSGGYGKTTYGQALAGGSNIAMFMAGAAYSKEKAKDIWNTLMSQRVESNAMELAAVFCAMSREGMALLRPTLKGDSVEVEHVYTQMPHFNEYARAIAVNANKPNGSQANYAPKNAEMAGLYGIAKNIPYWKDADKTLDELSFVGYSSVNDPRYALGMFIDKEIDENAPTSPKVLSGFVNELIHWLSEN